MNTFATPACRAEIVLRLRTVQADSERRWGRMTAHQMICHCADAFRMASGEVVVADVSGPLERTIVKWIALYAPLPWPGGRVETVIELNQLHEGHRGTRPGDFAADRAALEALVEPFAARAGAESWPPHPIFGRLSPSAWLRWAWLHTDHHLRQFGA